MPPPDSDEPNGWFSATRGAEPEELIAANPLAFVLAAVIAYRANWHGGFNRHGLAPGEAMLGDHKRYGLTQQEYRSAKVLLEKHGFATFKSTNKGTIGKLTGTRLFNIFRAAHNNPTNKQPTTGQQTANKPPTTNKELKNKEALSLSEAFPEPGWPSWDEWWSVCVAIELPEWRARDEWLKQEAASPKWRGIGSWKAYAQRVKGWWLRDGALKEPHTRKSFSRKPTAAPDYQNAWGLASTAPSP